MRTDFAAVRQYLEGAWLNLHGDEEPVPQLRETLDRLIEAVAVAECSRPPRRAEILPFPGKARSR
jgi:hypothetical protein